MEEIIFKVAMYLGILGFLAFTYSFLSGMRYIKVKAKFKLHKRVGVVGFSAMVVHGVVMCYFYFFT